jgi:branched-chain amino acid transport system permease protein
VSEAKRLAVDDMDRPGRLAMPARWGLTVRTKAGIGLVLVALFVPLFTNEYSQYVVNLALVYVLVTIGFNIAIGTLGQLAFCNVALFGIGAYTTGILMYHFQWPFWVALVPSGIAGAVAGFLASVPALRGIRALYLAIMTLAFGELMRWVYVHADAVTLGSGGMPVPTPTFFTMSIHSPFAKFYVFLGIVVLVVIGTSNLLRSRIGRAIVAIKNNELAAASLGIPTSRYIVLAFAWSGCIVGIAGSMFAILIGRVVPESFNLVELIQHFAMVMIGGVGSLAGAIAGAITLTWAPEMFRRFPGYEELFFGILLVVILLFLPRGLISLLTRFVPGLAERYYRE